MHHALEIEEILLTIFDHCLPPDNIFQRTPKPDLSTLARTCRTFKEPALNVLWRELDSAYAIARCLPEASHQQMSSRTSDWQRFLFSRSLTQPEWDILRSYTRRVLSISDFTHELDWRSVKIFLKPSPTQPLFPNLRSLSCHCVPGRTEDLLNMPFPSLTSLRLASMMYTELVTSLDSVSDFSSQTLRRIFVRLQRPDITFNNYFSSYICHWRNLQNVYCPKISLGVEALMHLSRIPTLTDLQFNPSATLLEHIAPTDSPLIFSNLRVFGLNSTSLDMISRLLALVQFPALTVFSAFPESYPSKSELSFLFDVLQRSGIGRTIQKFTLHHEPLPKQLRVTPQDSVPMPILGFADLQPCMAFSNLHSFSLDINTKVELTGSNLVSLISAWPHIEHLLINEEWGWNSPGIVPNELVQLLQTYPLLSRIAIAIDTEDYTECPHLPLSLGSTLSASLSIHVVDSAIYEGSIPVVAEFLAAIMPCSTFSLDAGSLRKMAPNALLFKRDSDRVRWARAYKLAKDIVCQNSSGTNIPHYSAGPELNSTLSMLSDFPTSIL